VESGFNILHMTILLSALACLAIAWRESAGRSIMLPRLFTPPVLAGFTAVIMLLIAAGEPRLLWIWLAAGVAGAIVGAVRGATMVMRVDQVRSRLRMPNGRHIFLVAIVLVLAAADEVAVAVWGNSMSPHRALAPAVAALCGGLLTGRAIAVAIRIPYAPNEEP
jgi:FtsH-binding integral membrane protein